MPLAAPEKRLRNRSLCTLYTPPLYPGYLQLKNPSMSKLTSIHLSASPMCTKHISTPILPNEENERESWRPAPAPTAPYKSCYTSDNHSYTKLPMTPENGVYDHHFDMKKLLSAHTGQFSSGLLSNGTGSPPVSLSIRSPSPTDMLHSHSRRATFDLISPECDDDDISKSMSLASEYSPVVRRPCHLATATLSHRRLQTTFSQAVSTSSYDQINTASLNTGATPNHRRMHRERQSKSRSPCRAVTRERKHVSKTSSGYGSGSSESEHELCAPLNTVEEVTDGTLTSSDVTRLIRRVSRFDQRLHRRNTEKSRRRSAPANLRETFSDQVLHVLYADGILKDDDSNIKQLQAVTRISRPESVIELSRKFSRSSAAQDAVLARVDKIMQVNDAQALQQLFERSNNVTEREAITERLLQFNGIHFTFNGKENRPKSSSNPPTPIHAKSDFRRSLSSQRALGGIASLPDTMQQPTGGNLFKQMDAQHKSSVGSGSRPASMRNGSSIKEALLRWCQIKTNGYQYCDVQNFSSSWADGMAFCALIHHFCPDAFDYSKLNPQNRRANLDLAFRVADEKADLMPLLEVDDMLMMGDKPDWKCVFTYVQTFYTRFKDQD